MRHLLFPLVFVLAACSTTKRTTSTTEARQTAEQSVAVASADSARSQTVTNTQAQTASESATSWHIRLSNDSAAPFVAFQMPDGSRFWSHATGISGTGTQKQTGMAITQTTQTATTGSNRDSVIKSRFDKAFSSKTENVEKKPSLIFSSSFWIAIVVAVILFCLLGCFFDLKRQRLL